MTNSSPNDVVVLIAEDQYPFREAVECEIEMMGFKPVGVENGKEGFEKFKEMPDVNLILSDIRMPVWDGAKFLEQVRSISRGKPPFVFMTGFTDMKLWDAYDKGADAVIGKPTSTAVLTNLFNIHLLSLDERWKKSAAVAPIATVTSKSEYLGKEVKLGRLGLFIPRSHAESVMGCKVDSVIAFDFAFETGEVSQLTGRGRIAWTRSGSGPELDDGVGILIERLEDNCREKVVAEIKKLDCLATIPKC